MLPASVAVIKKPAVFDTRRLFVGCCLLFFFGGGVLPASFAD